MKHAKLTLRQRAFVQSYADPKSPTFGNQTQSYLKAHPTAKSYKGASVSAIDTLDNPRVQTAVATLLTGKGITKDLLEDELVWNYQRCKEKDDTSNHRESVKVLAQLRGDWKEVREVRSVDDSARQVMRSLVQQALGSSTPALMQRQTGIAESSTVQVLTQPTSGPGAGCQ